MSVAITGTYLRSHRERLGLSQAKLSELAGIPQHLLSAFELGKGDLAEHYSQMLQNALDDDTNLHKVIDRKKRYQVHQYIPIAHDPTRVARHKQTSANSEYRKLLNALEEKRLTAKDDVQAFSAVSLFSGCGGLSLGFSWAGYKVKGFLELDSDARRIYRDNFPDALELGSDITSITPSILTDIAKRLGKIDVLVGGPPCQGFSLSGKRRIDDPRNILFRNYLNFVDALKPPVAIMENVRLLTSMKSPSGALVRDEIRNEFNAHGYNTDYFEVNAKDYGVPQHRERVLFIAVRRDINARPSMPQPTFGKHLDIFMRLNPYRTFADACSDLTYLESGEKDPKDPLHEAVTHPQHVINWLWNVKEGFSAHDNDDAENRPPSGYNTTYKRQIWEEPASTIQTTFGMISGCRNVHPIATRSLTVREAARIQSFPDAFKFNGNLGSVRTCIGNAVPPLLAYAIAEHIRKTFLLDFVKIACL